MTRRPRSVMSRRTTAPVAPRLRCGRPWGSEPADCFVKVDDAPEILLSSLVVLGALLALVGINNRRITKFTGPAGRGFETSADEAADEAKDEAEEMASDLPKEQRAAATEVAQSEAGARAVEQVVMKGRALTRPEVRKVARDAAAISMDRIRSNPDFE